MIHNSDRDTAWALALKVSSPAISGDDNRAAYLGALVAKHCPEFSPGHIAHIVNALQRLATSIHRFAVMDCNQGLTPRQAITQEARKASFVALANACGFNARTGGDPRGACAYLEDSENEGAGDGWGNGWAVYK